MTDIIVSGAGSTDINGTYVENGTYNSRPIYYYFGYQLRWNGSAWEFYSKPGKSAYYYYTSSDDVATPDLCTTWTVATYGVTPVPTVTAAGGSSQNLTLTCEAGSYSLTGSSVTLTHTPASQNLTDMIVSGAGTTEANGTYVYYDDLNGKPRYKYGSYYLTWENSQWQIRYSSLIRYYSTDDVATPDLVTTWIKGVFGTLPVPTVTAAGGSSQNLTLTCAAGSYSLTGTNADLRVTRHYTLTCEAGSYSLTGTNADLTVKRNYVLACSAGSYSLTGTNADLTVKRNYVLTCEAGSYTVTGADVTLTSSRTLICEPASGGAYPDIIVSGAGTSEANGTYVYYDDLNGKPRYKYGSYYLTWENSQWQIRYSSLIRYYSTDDVATPDLVTTWINGVFGTLPVPTVTAAPSLGYVLTGSDVTLTYTPAAQNLTLTCEAGSYALTGTNAGLTSARTMACNAGSYTLTGTNAGLYRALVMACNSGSYALTGTDASLTSHRIFALGVGSYVLVGTACGLFILTPTPSCRTATIEFENRTFAIPHENRTLEVKCH